MMGAAGLIATSGWLAGPAPGVCPSPATGAASVVTLACVGSGAGGSTAADLSLDAVALQSPELPLSYLSVPLARSTARERRLPSLVLAPKQGPPA